MLCITNFAGHFQAIDSLVHAVSVTHCIALIARHISQELTIT